MNHKLRKDAGSVLVFITLMIVILMVMVGVGLDTGYLTLSRSMGQRAVDMAALAGAAGLAKGDTTAIQSNIQQIMVTGTTNDGVISVNSIMLCPRLPRKSFVAFISISQRKCSRS